MRTIYNFALASVLVFTLAAAAPELNAQTRRSTTTTSTSSSSDNKSATATRSAASSSSTANRSTTTASRSAGTSNNRQSTTTTTANRNENTATRTAAPSGGAQVNRGNSSGTTTGSQVNRGTGNTGTTNTGSNGTAARRNSGNGTTGSTAARQATGTSRSTQNGAATTTETPSRRVTTTTRSANNGTAQTPTTQTGRTSSTVTRSNATATSSKGLTSAPEASSTRSNVTRGGVNNANKGAVPNVNYSDGGNNRGSIRMDDDRNLNRVPPREREFTSYKTASAFYGHDPHFFGYRVQTLPPRYRRITHWGREYYYYDNVYYLRYGNWYVISRPPFGVAIDIALRDLAFASVRFSYYHNVYRTFDIIDSNYRTILEQNREIARNNARLAAQNSALALNSNRALSAYEIATALGLVQSFANINTEYFYEDGVFYVATKKNRYEVIVPPAGALVNELPDDYDIIVLNGVEYYKVDDTVYRLVLVDGIPALEVLGQMYGNMARKYNYYY